MYAGSSTASMPAIRTSTLRVAYDAQAFVSGDGGTGKGVQLRNLIDSQWAQFQGYAPSLRKQPATEGIVHGGNRRYLIWQQASLPRLLKSWSPHIFLAPYNTAPLWLPPETRLVLVLHDMILMEKFKASTLRMRFLNTYRRHLVPLSVARSTHVLTVSEFSRSRILEYYPEAHVTVIPCTIAESWFVGSAFRHQQQRDNYLLLVTATPLHKNTGRALRAYAGYVKAAGTAAANLRVVGLGRGASSFHPMVHALGLSEKVTFEPFVSTATLQLLYRRAKAVLVPSLLEGFGIPVLEGMASGTPVIASRSSSLSEVGGDAILYFDPLEELSIAAAILELTGNPALQLELAKRGQVQAAKFHQAIVHRKVDDFWLRIGSEPATAS